MQTATKKSNRVKKKPAECRFFLVVIKPAVTLNIQVSKQTNKSMTTRKHLLSLASTWMVALVLFLASCNKTEDAGCRLWILKISVMNLPPMQKWMR